MFNKQDTNLVNTHKHNDIATAKQILGSQPFSQSGFVKPACVEHSTQLDYHDNDPDSDCEHACIASGAW